MQFKCITNIISSIAVIGTTSSGKSTLVNALIGWRVAPIEADEMSSGVLVFRGNSRRRLVVEKTDGAVWECGQWEDVPDGQMYERIRNIMYAYQRERKERACNVPWIWVEGPLLAQKEEELLGLSRDLDLALELLDLPGLKSVQDANSLDVIREHITKAFFLVTLDYTQTNDVQRGKLLDELKKTVEYMNGRTDSMLFVLNRVDACGKDDNPLEERIQKLQEEIQAKLGLQEKPEILPMEARFLYRAQCAWGAADRSGPVTTKEERLAHLVAMFDESASSIRRIRTSDPEFGRKLREMEDLVDAGELPSDADLLALLEYVREWSGGSRLWARLRKRLEERFPILVLMPILRDILDQYDELSQNLQNVTEIRMKESKEQLNKIKKQLEESKKTLHEIIETRTGTGA